MNHRSSVINSSRAGVFSYGDVRQVGQSPDGAVDPRTECVDGISTDRAVARGQRPGIIDPAAADEVGGVPADAGVIDDGHAVVVDPPARAGEISRYYALVDHQQVVRGVTHNAHPIEDSSTIARPVAGQGDVLQLEHVGSVLDAA